MFENINNFFKKLFKIESPKEDNSGKEAKERLHLVLMQDRANVSADFLEMMKQEIIEVIKKYIDVDENEIDVRLTNQENNDGSKGAPALYANIPILNIKEENQTQQPKQNTPNDVGVGFHPDPNQTQQSNQNTPNNVGVGVPDDPNKSEQSNENTSNNIQNNYNNQNTQN